jgi:hypothetical protein
MRNFKSINRYLKMKILVILICTILCGGLLYAQSSNIPHLQKKGTTTQLVVDNKPFLMLAGELHNSSTSSAQYMNPIWERMAKQNLNTIIAPVSWELIEPKEGTFDFSLVDKMILGARKQNLKLVVIWFASWKNGVSTYTPEWVKKDEKRFPLVKNSRGKVKNVLSTFGENSLKADATAFTALMQHIKLIDSKEHTVLMIQVENEMGVLSANRDYSDMGNKAFSENVPTQLMTYLEKNKDNLYPALVQAWAKNGYKKTGTWEEVFGKGESYKGDDWQSNFSYYTEELFMAWNYAKYVGEIAKVGKAQYPIPMYVNAWLRQSKGRSPGSYPTGGPLPQVIDVWRAAAPSIDFIAPDIYAVNQFDWICQEFTKSGNPLFIPETTCTPAGSTRAFYAYGKYHALGYSPFGVNGGMLFGSPDANDFSLKNAYGCLKNISPFILKYRGTENLTGLFLEQDQKSTTVEMGDYVITAQRFTSANVFELTGGEFGIKGEEDRNAAAILIIKLAQDEFLVAGGGGIQVKITGSSSNKWPSIDYASVDELTSENGKMMSRRLNGDDTGMGGPIIPVGEYKMYKIKLYGYGM